MLPGGRQRPWLLNSLGARLACSWDFGRNRWVRRIRTRSPRQLVFFIRGTKPMAARSTPAGRQGNQSPGSPNCQNRDVAARRDGAAALCFAVPRPWMKSPESLPSNLSASRPLPVPSAACTLVMTSSSRVNEPSIRASATVPLDMSSPAWVWVEVANELGVLAVYLVGVEVCDPGLRVHLHGGDRFVRRCGGGWTHPQVKGRTCAVVDNLQRRTGYAGRQLAHRAQPRWPCPG